MIIVPQRMPWRRQPTETATINRNHPLGAALQCVWTGHSISGRELIRGANLAPAASSSIGVVAPGGVAIKNSGTAGSLVTPPVVISTYPYVMAGYGYFNSTGANWTLGNFNSSGGGTLVRMAVSTSPNVAMDVRYAFGTQRTLTINVGTNTAAPICMIFVAYSATDYRFFANGKQSNGTLTPGTLPSLNLMMTVADTLNGGMWLQGYGKGVPVSDSDALKITANPEGELWGMFF